MRLAISLILLFASLAAALAQAPAPVSVEALVKRWHVLNSDCRGSSPISDRACDERPKVAAQLARLGWSTVRRSSRCSDGMAPVRQGIADPRGKARQSARGCRYDAQCGRLGLSRPELPRPRNRLAPHSVNSVSRSCLVTPWAI